MASRVRAALTQTRFGRVDGPELVPARLRKFPKAQEAKAAPLGGRAAVTELLRFFSASLDVAVLSPEHSTTFLVGEPRGAFVASGGPTRILLVLGYWVGVRRPFHLSLFLTAPRMALPQDPSTHREYRFGADFSRLSSCRDPQAALKFSYRSDRVTRY